MNAGIDQPCTRSLKGMSFRATLIFVVFAWDAEPKKPRRFFGNCMLKNYFLSLMGQGNHCLVLESENDRRHPERYNIWRKAFISNSWVRTYVRNRLLHFPFHPVSRGLYLFRCTRSLGRFSNDLKSFRWQTLFRSMMGQREHVTNRDIL